MHGRDQGALPIKVRVFRPDGVEEMWPRREMLTEGGRARFTLPIAYSAMPGVWKVTARDVFSNQVDEVQLTVRPAEQRALTKALTDEAE